VIRDSNQRRYSETVALTTLIAWPVSLSLHRDSWGGWPTINQHDCLLLREWGGSLPRRVAFGPLAFGKSSHGHVVLHHGAFLQLVSDMVCMIWAGCFKKLFKVIGGLSCLELRIMLIDGDELFVGVTSVLVANTLVTVGGDRDSLWSLLRPLLSLIAPHLAPLSVVLVGTPRPPLEAALALLYRKNNLDCFLARGIPGGDVKEFFCGLWLVTTELVYQGLAVCARPECREDIGNADLGEFVTLLRETLDVILQEFSCCCQQPFKSQGLSGHTYMP
jgi:hypothetical protein